MTSLFMTYIGHECHFYFPNMTRVRCDHHERLCIWLLPLLLEVTYISRNSQETVQRIKVEESELFRLVGKPPSRAARPDRLPNS